MSLPRLHAPATPTLDGRTTSTPTSNPPVLAGRRAPRRVDKPWGHELIWADETRYVGKILHIRAGEALSLQYHERKQETIHVLSGTMRYQVGPSVTELQELVLGPGDGYCTTPGTVHRMVAVTDCDVLEASTPDLDDVVRLEDRYGRDETSRGRLRVERGGGATAS